MKKDQNYNHFKNDLEALKFKSENPNNAGLANFILEDILESSFEDYLLISPYDELLFFITVSTDINELIHDMLVDYNTQENESLLNLLKDAIHIKITVDKKINLNELDEIQKTKLLQDFGLQIKTPQNSAHSFIRLIDPKHLPILHKELIRKGFIYLPYQEFEIHFIENDGDLPKIQWIGTIVDLAGLFKELKIAQLVSYKSTNQMIEAIEKHFLVNNQPFKYRSLHSTFSEAELKDKDIKKIIEEMKSL